MQFKDKESRVTRTANVAVTPWWPIAPSECFCTFVCYCEALTAKTSFVYTHFYCQLDCAQAFLDSSAPFLLPPWPTKPLHMFSSTLPGRKSGHFWSTYYVYKGLINPNYLSSPLHPLIHLFVPPSIQLSLSAFFQCFLLQNWECLPS